MNRTDRAQPIDAAPGSNRMTRRTLLKSVVAIAAAAVSPFEFAGAVLPGQSTTATNSDSPTSRAPAKHPRWYGFNLLEYFSTDPDWMKYFPYEDDGMFREDDFRWIRDWGFNWVRLPMDYRFWTDPQDLFKIREETVVPIDRAVRLGEKYCSISEPTSTTIARIPHGKGERRMLPCHHQSQISAHFVGNLIADPYFRRQWLPDFQRLGLTAASGRPPHKSGMKSSGVCVLGCSALRGSDRFTATGCVPK